ncbi:DUF3592 domain-containing protein [Candidatus Peregrinibacteria bacterium]|nr:DUF3592 domain-containing protein [Candidatus Peregrinibacteria bacterium]
MLLRFGTRLGKPSESFQPKKPLTKKGVIIFLIISISISLIFVCVGALPIYRNYIRNAQWNAVPAIIINSEISRHLSGTSGTTYGANIEYEYVINGKKYFGAYDSLSSNFSSYANKLLDKYSQGAQIIVKVNPNDPTESALQENIDWFWYLFLGVGTILMVIFGAVGIFMLKKVKS